MMFGGRTAEELIFGEGEVTTGASNDIQQATALARRMVTEWGMSDKLGRLRYSDNEEQVFLGRSMTQTRNVSDETAKLIDSEVRRIIEEAEATARRSLQSHMEGLHAVAKALLAYETLSGAEVRAVLAGEPIVRGGDPDPGRPRARGSVPPTGAAQGRGPFAETPELQPQG